MEKTFSGQILCSCAFGANIRFYTKQRARHETPFLQPPPLLRRASMSPPPPPPQSNFQVAFAPMKGLQWLKIGYDITPSRFLTKVLKIGKNVVQPLILALSTPNNGLRDVKLDKSTLKTPNYCVLGCI